MPENASHPEVPDLSGRRFGDYELIRRLGRGGMADVYLAQQQSLQRRVAFKVLKANLAEDPAYVRRFKHEARAAAQLVHTNIVQIFDVGEIDGIHFITQEYVQGHNLRQLLERNGPLSAGAAINIMRQAALALHKAAERGIIHRDIKPENIMLSATGEAKVADFGLARASILEDGTGLTQVGLVMGTPLYMSPEQAEGKEVDPRSDLYSLGVSFFHLLAGRPPFQGETALSIAVQHLQSEPPLLRSLRSELPEDLCRVIHRLLCKAPEKRYQQSTDLLRDLRTIVVPGDDTAWPDSWEDWATSEQVEQTEALASRQLGHSMSLEHQRLHRQRRVWGLLAAGLIGAVLIGAALGWAMRPASLLQNASATNETPKMDDLLAQYTHAWIRNTEPAIRAVWEMHSPRNANDELLVLKAKRMLVKLFFREGRPQDASGLFDEMSQLSDDYREFRLLGRVGRAYLLKESGSAPDAWRDLILYATIDLRALDKRLADRALQELPEELSSDLREAAPADS